MRRTSMLFGLIITFASLALVPATAEAQRPVTFGVGGGVSLPTGDLSDEVNAGFHVQGTVGLDLAALPVDLRGDVAFNRMESGDYHVEILSGTLNAIYRFPGVAARPYIIGGLGIYGLEASLDHGDHAHDDHHTEFGVNLGAGVDFALAGFNFFAEARLHNVFGDDHSDRFIPLSVGVRF